MFEWLRDSFELQRGGRGQNVRAMDGLRGFAVLLVFLVHYEALIAPWIADEGLLLLLAGSLRIIGNCGVDLFFLLSGYLIYGSLLTHRQSFLRFFGRRLKRIYPAFTAVFFVYVVLSFLFPSQSKIPEDNGALYLLANYLLLPGLFPIRPMITVAWSLSYEMFYYLVLPVVVALFRLRTRRPLWRVMFFLSITAAFSGCIALNDGPIRLIMFIGGIMLYEAINHGELRASSTAGLLALMAGLVCTLWPVAGPGGMVVQVLVLSVTFFVFGLACFGNEQAWLPAAFSWTPLRWLGSMSYSYYLLHGLALKAAFVVLAQFLPPTGEAVALHWVLLLPMLALTLILSAGLFLLIERPFSLSESRGRPRLSQLGSAESRS